MKRIKTILSLLLATAMSAVLLCSCGLFGTTSDTFKGKLSEKTYDTQDAAVTAFLKEEIDGLTTRAELVEYVKEADLGKEEIAKLPLGDVSADKVTHAERGKVSYRANILTGAAAATAESAEDLETHGLYLLEIDGKFRYFVPPTEVGEPITKSYFEDVFDSEKYVNCTVEATQSMDMITTIDGKDETMMKTSTTYVEKFTKDAVEVIMTMESDSFQPTTSTGYLLESGGRLILYTFIDMSQFGVPGLTSTWSQMDFTDLISKLTGKEAVTLSDYMRNSFGETDYSFFEKTETGFQISSPERYQMMLRTVMESVGMNEDMFDTLGYDPFSATLTDFSSDYTIKNGRFDKCTATATISYDLTYATGKLTTPAVMEMIYKDYGKTTVTVPDSLREYIAAQGQAN